MARQLSLVFGNRHGGRRKGAGRNPKGAQAGVKHRPRPEFVRRTPVLVTQRIGADCPSLRRSEVLAIFRRLVVKLSDETFAVVHWSLQTTHFHAVVEAQDSVVLARKLGGFLAQLAKQLNRHWKRSGKVFPDRFEARVLASPTVVRAALVYTLGNARKHGSWFGRGPDPYSSGIVWSGWADWCAQSSGLPEARTWLLRVGWRKLGPLSTLAGPKSEQDPWEEAERRRRMRRRTQRPRRALARPKPPPRAEARAR